MVESIRYAYFLAPDGLALVSTQRIIPITISAGPFDYPEDPEGMVRERFKHYILCPCLDIARELGEPRAANVVMVGLLSRFLPFEDHIWSDVMKEQIKPKYMDMNREAFEAGRDFNNQPLFEIATSQALTPRSDLWLTLAMTIGKSWERLPFCTY